MLLEATEITKSFDGQSVLRGVSLSVARGEIVALLGPSGCGKTTLLRIIAGLESADVGNLSLNGQDLSKLPVHKRGFGMVFQDFALFPHKNVAENVAFGLRMLNWEKSLQKERVTSVLQLVGLAGFEQRQVYELSGGEQQRVALARSLAPSPRLLLLDEPLGSLDRALRERLMGQLRTILKSAGGRGLPYGVLGVREVNHPTSGADAGRQQIGMTSIYVTHDQEEAFAIADRVLVMNAGRIEQQGLPFDLYHQPHNAFVARFLGMDNLVEAKIVGRDPLSVRTPVGDFYLDQHQLLEVDDIQLLIRPEAGIIEPQRGEGANTLQGKLENISFRGRHRIVTLTVPSAKGQVNLKFAFDTNVILPTDQPMITIRLKQSELMLVRS